ncbi:hypothetical protein CTEN210_17292 [Chaetoceros tenuissimus]|uniref:Calmodulin-lysine N-methyltransferase n=1 Tax=Chaetoceros tenuissimus TaxID=426638 RepID=A0AAD3DCK9_9STRA|nr:hypothetical protein CTEN210_17292 [Chaetoceros tenuissimus]
MKIPAYSSLFVLIAAAQVAAFAPSQVFSTKNINSHLYMSEPASDLTGKIVAQRYIYRLSPERSSVTTPYTLEERQYYTVAEDRSLEPFGEKHFIFRDDVRKNPDVEAPEESVKKNGMPRVYTRIGKPLYTVKDLKEDDGDEELGGSVWESSYVMALYCMEHPEIITGKGLELGSGVGVGSILATIGAGLASGSTETSTSSGYQSIEDIANTPVASPDSDDEESLMAPVPKNLQKIVLSDTHENLLNNCLDNLGSAAFPIAKAEVSYLDWKTRVSNDMKNAFDFIIGCDCAYYFPLVNPLARTVAYSLKSSPYDRRNNDQIVRGRFLHIGPEHRESIDDLKRKLGRGYKMTSRMKEIVLESIALVPLIIDSLEDVEKQMNEEVEGSLGGYVEYQSVDSSRYTALTAVHNEDYDGLNGDYFFPAETGREGSYGDSAQELDYGTEAM